MQEAIKKHISDLLDIKGDFLKASEKDTSSHHTDGYHFLAQAAKVGQVIELLAHDKPAEAIELLQELGNTSSLKSRVLRSEAKSFLSRKADKEKMIERAEQWEKCAHVCKNVQQAINPKLG